MRSPVVQEFPYRHNLLGVVAFFLINVAVLAGGVHMALHERRDILINGCLPLQGGWATTFRWAIAGIGAVLSSLAAWMLWVRIAHPGQRIAFSADGVHLPRTRWGVREYFVRFDEIGNLAMEAVNDQPICLHFWCPLGHFTVSRQKTRRRDFDAICTLLATNVRRPQPAA